MLTPLIPPDDRSRERAYRVPWRIERVHDSHRLVVNAGRRPLDAVRAFVHVAAPRSRSDRTETHSWGCLTPGEGAELCLCALEPEDCIVTLAWFRPDDGLEYVWRFAP